MGIKKRFSAGILATVLAMTSLQFPQGYVMAAEGTVTEEKSSIVTTDEATEADEQETETLLLSQHDNDETAEETLASNTENIEEDETESYQEFEKITETQTQEENAETKETETMTQEMQTESVIDEIIETQDETPQESAVEENETEIDLLLDDEGNIASGATGNITWVIDKNGKLTIEGTGDFYKPWYSYKDYIKTIKINVSEMTNMSFMFDGLSNVTTIDLKGLDTSNATDMSHMFEGCSSLTSLDLSCFDTSNVTDMSNMFMYCSNLKSLDISNFDTSNVINMLQMFRNCNNITTLDLSNFNTSNVTNMSCMFAGVDSLTNLDLSNFNTSNVTDMSGMFSASGYGDFILTDLNISNFDTSNVTDMSAMFGACHQLESLDVSNFDTSNVTDMSSMFCCNSLESLDVSNFDTSNVTDMSHMFCCNSLESLDVSNFDTSNVTDMSHMFCCNSLESLDVSNFNTANVTDMRYMFDACSSLASLDLSNFDTANVTNMGHMFTFCQGLTNLDLSSFNTGNVTDMSDMFRNCSSLSSLDLSNFNFSNVTNIQNMLNDCITLKTIYTPKNITKSVKLPAASSDDIWYRSDGTIVTELPQNLSYSVVLGKNYIPEEKQPDIAETVVIELKDGESAVLIYDKSTKTPVEGASVTIDNKSYPTNAKGLAVFAASDKAAKKQITVKASNYNDLTTYQQIRNKKLIRIGVEPDTDSLQITSAIASLGDKNYDLLREKFVLGYAEDFDKISNLTKDKLKLEIKSNQSDVTYSIIATDQAMATNPNSRDGGSKDAGLREGGGGHGFGDDEIILTSEDGKFSIDIGIETVKIGKVDIEQTAVTNIMPPEDKMYVRVTDKDGNSVTKKLNIYTTHNYLTQEKTSQKDSFKLGDELKVSIPDDVPFIGGGEYTFEFSDKMPVEMEIDEDGKIKIALNKPTDTKMEDFGRVYKDMEDAYKNMDKRTLNAMSLSGVKSFDAGLLKISGKVCGYGEGNINEVVKGNPTIKLGIMAELEGKVGYEQRWVIGIVPIKIFVEASAKGNVDFQAKVKFENWIIKDLDFSGGSFNVTVALEAGAGVGCSYIYELEVSLDGSLNYINKPRRNYQKIWLEASGKVQRTAFYFFEKPLWQSDTYSYTVYEQGRDKASAYLNPSAQNVENSSQESALRITDRNYLNYTNGYHTQTDTIQLASYTSEEENKNIIVKSAVLPTTKSTLVDTSNGRYLFWADDITSRDSYNRSALMYAKSVNGTDWSAPNRLLPETEDSTLDGYYSVFADGNDIHILWQDATRQITEEDDMSDVLKAFSVKHVVLDAESDTVTENQYITQESGCYMYPSVVAAGAECYLAYVQNMLDSDDIDGKNTHHLYVVTSKKEAKEVVIPQNTQIANMSAGIFQGKPSLVCELDMDGSADTSIDREIYLYDFETDSFSRITDDAETDTMPVIADSGNIYWFHDKAIMKLSGTDETLKDIWNGDKAVSQTAFTVATDGSGKDTILWEMVDLDAEDGSVTIFQTSENSDGSWGNIVKFAETTGTIASSISAADGGNGLQVAHTEGVFLPDGTELKDLCIAEKENTTDISVEYIDFDESAVTNGNPLLLKADIVNNGNTTVDTADVFVNDTVITTLSGMNLKPLESREFEISGFRVPASLQKSTPFTLKLTVSGEKNLDDNVANFILGCPDVFAETDYRIDSGRTWLDINVYNDASYEASGKVLVHKGYEDGEVIFSKDYKSLNADNGYAYSVDLGDYEDVYTKYYVEVTSNTEENITGNNIEFAYIGYGTGVEQEEQPEETYEITSVDFGNQSISLGISNTAQLSAKDNKGNAFETGELLWVSNDKRIANVDQTGLVTAYRAGTTQITAYYGDLSCACTVTVVGAADENSLTVTFDTQGGEQLAPITGIKPNSTINLPTSLSREGYVFEGWYTQPVGGIKVDSSSLTVTETITLYAHWRLSDEGAADENSLTVSFDTQGGEELAPITGIKPNSTINLPTSLTREGYVFEGWYTQPVGGIKVDNSSFTVTETITLYAHWRLSDKGAADENSLTVSFDTQGGEELAPITGIKPNSTISLPTSLTREGYVFEGWYTQPVGGDKVSDMITVTESVTLYAHWIGGNKPESPEEPTDTDNQGDGLWISGVSKSGYAYIGEAVKPAVKVYDKTILLTEKTDYTISYKNNTKVGKATITVIGKGNYSGKETVTFDILPIDIGSEDVYAMDFYVKTGKKVQKPIPKLYYMGTKLKNNKDFTISYANISNVYSQSGEYNVTITGKGNYTGTRTLKLMAVEKIVESKPVSIAKAALNEFNKTFTYTGKACRQECTLTVKTSEGEKTLVEGMDYTVQYANNIKAGTAAVTYYGRNGYTGKLKKTYKILPYDILKDQNAKIKYENNLEYIYAKGGSKPKPVVTFEGKTLKEGVDYTLSYKNNKAVIGKSTPCVTVIGKRNFKGKISINFTIKAQDLSRMTLVSGDKVYKNKANIYKIAPKLMDLDGKLLSTGKDFDRKSITYVYENDVVLENGVSKEAGSEVEKTDIIPADTQIRITLNCGSGSNYTGTFTGTYRITKADIKSAKVTIPKQIYTGNNITLDKSQITVKLSGVTLKPEDYEIIRYADNVKKGKASVTIKGKGNYGGVKTVKFTIGAKGFLWWWRK